MRADKEQISSLKAQNKLMSELLDKYAKLSIGDMVSASLKGITIADLEEVFDDLEESEQEELMREASDMVKMKLFLKARNWIIDGQIRQAVMEAKNLDELNYERATIRGPTLYVEEVELLSNKYKSLIAKRQERFDKNEPI